MKKKLFAIAVLAASLASVPAKADFVAPPPPGGGGGGGAAAHGAHHSSLSVTGPAAVVAYGLCLYYQSHRGKPGRKTLYPGEAGNIIMCHPLMLPLAIASIVLGPENGQQHAKRHRSIARRSAKKHELARD